MRKERRAVRRYSLRMNYDSLVQQTAEMIHLNLFHHVSTSNEKLVTIFHDDCHSFIPIAIQTCLPSPPAPSFSHLPHNLPLIQNHTSKLNVHVYRGSHMSSEVLPSPLPGSGRSSLNAPKVSGHPHYGFGNREVSMSQWIKYNDVWKLVS